MRFTNSYQQQVKLKELANIQAINKHRNKANIKLKQTLVLSLQNSTTLLYVKTI